MLGVAYLIFNEGYAATEGPDRVRPALCEEALRLGRVLAGLAPREPEVHGLAALMEIQASCPRGAAERFLTRPGAGVPVERMSASSVRRGEFAACSPGG